MELRYELVNQLLDAMGDSRRAVVIQELPSEAQGASGSEVRYYAACLSDGKTERFITKSATQLERRILQLLAQKEMAIPSVGFSASTSERTIVVMPYVACPPKHHGPFDAHTQAYAMALARLHATMRSENLSWVPEAGVDNLYLDPWGEAWERNLAIDAFSKEFRECTSRLEVSFARFLSDMRTVSVDSTTLINADLHPTHFRLYRGKPCFIDWEQSRRGSFYLDLVNYFSKETALLYRDALDQCGWSIPVVDFLDRFHVMGRYMGFRYLEVGLNAWRAAHEGVEAPEGYYASQRWFLYYCLELALNGR